MNLLARDQAFCEAKMVSHARVLGYFGNVWIWKVILHKQSQHETDSLLAHFDNPCHDLRILKVY